MVKTRACPLAPFLPELSYEDSIACLASIFFLEPVQSWLATKNHATHADNLSPAYERCEVPPLTFIGVNGSCVHLQFIPSRKYSPLLYMIGLSHVLTELGTNKERAKIPILQGLEYSPDTEVPPSATSYCFSLTSSQYTHIGHCHLKMAGTNLIASHLRARPRLAPVRLEAPIVLRTDVPASVSESLPIPLKNLEGTLHCKPFGLFAFRCSFDRLTSFASMVITEKLMNDNQPQCPLDIHLGQLELSLEEAIQLRPGMTLEFDLQEELQVTLLLAGNMWAQGRLRLSDEGAYISVERSYISALDLGLPTKLSAQNSEHTDDLSSHA